jgi:hypothetical protein
VRPVNLLPPRYRPARASGERPGIGYAALGALALILLLVLLWVTTSNGINDAKDKKAQADADRAVAEAKVGQLSAFGDFQTLAAQRQSSVVGLAEVRFDFERLMRETALVLPHNVYLTSFTAAPGGEGGEAATGGASATGPVVTLAGCAPSHDGVAAAVVRLRKLHNAVDVDLQSSAKAQAASGTAVVCKVAWNATVTMQPETAPTAPAAVPARLGGGQ